MANGPEPSGRVFHEGMADHVARAEVEVDADRGAVWRALTEPEQVSAWMMGARVDTDWQVGSPITWRGEMGGRPFEDKGEVLEHDAPNRLSMTHYSPLMGAADVPESYHTIVYDLTGDRPTRVALTQGGNDSAEQAEQFSANWQGMLDALKSTVEGS